MKIYTVQMSWVTWPTWPPCTFMIKTLKKSTSPEAIDRWPWNFVCSIVYASTTKVTNYDPGLTLTYFTSRSNLITQAFVLGKSENYLFFGSYCSLRSQSCLKHSAKWVNEVEWVSKVKVILWPWSKVTQISKLNVWLLACIIKWAIQGLMALLLNFITTAWLINPLLHSGCNWLHFCKWAYYNSFLLHQQGHCNMKRCFLLDLTNTSPSSATPSSPPLATSTTPPCTLSIGLGSRWFIIHHIVFIIFCRWIKLK